MDPFLVFGLRPAYALDLAELEKTHRRLCRALHPDRYREAAPSERRAALTRAVEVNEAYRILRDPALRAEALFRGVGVTWGEGKEPPTRPSFLMEVMESREALAEARGCGNRKAIEALGKQERQRLAEVERRLSEIFPGDARATGPDDLSEGRLAAHGDLLGMLRFHLRFLEELETVEQELEPPGPSDTTHA